MVMIRFVRAPCYELRELRMSEMNRCMLVVAQQGLRNFRG